MKPEVESDVCVPNRVWYRLALSLLTSAMGMSSGSTPAGAASLLDVSFDPGAGPNGPVFAVADDAEGRVLIGGRFQLVSGRPRTGLARLRADGGLDPGFVPGLGGAPVEVYVVRVQPDGNILVAGSFSEANGLMVGPIARFRPDGEWDPGFAPLRDVSAEIGTAYINDLAVLSDGSILVAGNFDRVGSESRPGLARLGVDGRLDRAFVPARGGEVVAIEPLPDGGCLAVGSAIVVNDPGTTVSPLRRLNADGSLDNHFDGGSRGLLSYLSDVAVYPDGRTLVVGDLAEASRWVGAWDASGREITDFANGVSGPVVCLGDDCRSRAWSVLALPDGGAYVGGSFGEFLGRPWRCLARMDTQGCPDPAFDPGTGLDGALPMVWALSRSIAGSVYVAGEFESFDGVTRRNVLRLLSSEDRPMQIRRQADDLVLLEGQKGRVWVEAGGEPPPTVRWERDGVPLPGGTSAAWEILSATTTDAGTYVGRLTHPSGSAQTKPIRVRVKPRQPGQVDPDFHAGRGPAHTNDTVSGAIIHAVVSDREGGWWIGGRFSQFNGELRTGLVRLNADGSVHTRPLPALTREVLAGSEATGVVHDLVATPEGKVVVGGDFAWAGDRPVGGLVRLRGDGALDESFATDVTLSRSQPGDGPVVRLAWEAGGGLWVAARTVTSDDMMGRVEVMKLRPDGRRDGSFVAEGDWMGAELLPIHDIAEGADGSVWVGGDLTYILPRAGDAAPWVLSHLVRLQANGDLHSTSPPATVDGAVDAVEALPNGAVVIAGAFHEVGGRFLPGLALLDAIGAPDPAFEPFGAPMEFERGDRVRFLGQDRTGRWVLAGAFQGVAFGHPGAMVLARLTPEGRWDPDFDIGGGLGIRDSTTGRLLSNAGRVDAWAIDADDRILVAGRFDAVDAWPRQHLALISGGNARLDPPDFLVQPHPAVDTGFGSAEFRAHAYGYPRPELQWLGDDLPLEGATNPVYRTTLADPSGAQATRYRARASNTQGSQVTHEVNLLRLGLYQVAVHRVNAGVRITVQIPTPRRVWLEFKDDLRDAEWRAALAADRPERLAGTTSGAVAYFVDCPATGRRFYRVRVED